MDKLMHKTYMLPTVARIWDLAAPTVAWQAAIHYMRSAARTWNY